MAALEEGVISPYTRFYCNGRFPSSGELGKTHWNCWLPGGHGHDNVTEALSESCDVFFYNVGYAVLPAPRLRARGVVGAARPGAPHGARHPRGGGRPRADARVAAGVLRDRDRQDLEAGQLGPHGDRPGRPAGHAAADGRGLRGDRQRRQGRAAAPRPEDALPAGQGDAQVRLRPAPRHRHLVGHARAGAHRGCDSRPRSAPRGPSSPAIPSPSPARPAPPRSTARATTPGTRATPPTTIPSTRSSSWSSRAATAAPWPPRRRG